MIRALVILALMSSTAKSSALSDDEKFRYWQLETGKKYPSFYELKYRFQVFTKNLRVINDLNKKYRDVGTVFRANKFADLDEEEFRRTYLMPPREPTKFPPNNRQLASYEALSGQLPSSFDWRNKGVVTAIRNQGSAGTCWAFSAVQNIESQWAMKGMNLTELSVEQVVDCDGMEDVSKQKADCGVFGGWPYLAYQYVQKEGGLTAEKDYPYCCGLGGGKGTCFVCPAPGYNKTLCGPPAEYCQESDSCHAKLDKSKFVKGLNVKGWTWFSDNETEIAHHLMEVGPLSVAINAATLQFYHSGIYDPLICDPKALDHAVLITGFGEQRASFGRVKTFWTVKNSWGEKWGQNGYFHIARGKGKCGINTQVTTSHLE